MPSLILTTCDGDAHPELKQQWWDWKVRPVSAITLWSDKEPIAIARMFDVQLSLPGVSLECIGIGGVFVKPEHRGCGHGKYLLEGLAINKGRHGMPFVLRTRNEAIYRRVGFSRIGVHDGQAIMARSRCTVILSEGDWKLSYAF